MNFLTTPHSYTRTQRTSRQVCRDACAIERFERKDTHATDWVIGAIAVAVIATLAVGVAMGVMS